MKNSELIDFSNDIDDILSVFKKAKEICYEYSELKKLHEVLCNEIEDMFIEIDELKKENEILIEDKEHLEEILKHMKHE